MELLIQTTDYPVFYKFNLLKKSTYRNKKISNIESSGVLKFQVHLKNENKEYIFHCNDYIQSGVKNPLIFNPVKWFFEKENKIFLIKSKDEIKLQWKRYKDKYRTTKNITDFLVLERLLFHTPLGFEYSTFSNGPYLPFFLDFTNVQIEKETLIKGMDFIMSPLNIPVNTTFICSDIDRNIMFLDGWISMDEDKMDLLIANKNFQTRAKSYHFSRDFQIQSKIRIAMDIETGYIHSAYFNLSIKGEDGKLEENMEYKLHNIDKSYIFKSAITNTHLSNKETPYKTYEGKSYTKEEWGKKEQELWEIYANKNNIRTENSNPEKKGGKFFLDEKDWEG